MPRSIQEGFDDFLIKLKPTTAESTAAASHRASIETRLRASFGLLRFTRIGSFGNGTSISGYSDVDYLAVLPTSQLTRTSNASLAKVRQSLDERFPSTGVMVRCPAVVVPFGSRAETTEVVPADYIREGAYKEYEIADCNNGWMRASPDAHNAYVRLVDDKLNGKVKPLIRFVKAWKYFREVPISSFYLELQIARYAQGENTIVYQIDVKNVLRRLLDSGLSDMRDPMGVSGNIPACKSSVSKSEALSKLATAVTRAEKARLAETDGKISDAFDWWRLLYGERFPSYYRI